MYCKNCGEALNDNQAICLKCGVEVGKGNSHCPNCGNAVAPDASFCLSCGVALKKSAASGVNHAAIGLVQKRDLVKAIIFSIITCGIYGIYWFVCLTNDMNRLTGNENDTNGGTSFLLSLVTCGIYTYYWAYKMGSKRDTLDGINNNSSILYLLLTFFGLGIVVYALMQDAINKAVDVH